MIIEGFDLSERTLMRSRISNGIDFTHEKPPELLLSHCRAVGGTSFRNAPRVSALSSRVLADQSIALPGTLGFFNAFNHASLS